MVRSMWLFNVLNRQFNFFLFLSFDFDGLSVIHGVSNFKFQNVKQITEDSLVYNIRDSYSVTAY